MALSSIITGLIALFQGPYLQFVGIIALGFIAAGIIHLFLRVVVGYLTAKTKTDLDDLILAIVIRPIYFLVVVASIQVATKVVESFLQDWTWVDHLFFIAYTLIFTYILARIISLLISRWLQVSKKFERTPKLLSKAISVIVYIIAFLIILKDLNVDITPFIATLGIGGLAVGLALQNTLSNLFGGIHIISDEPIKVGDYIELQGLADVSGTVEDIGWRSTRIKSPGNNVIVVPNAKLADSIIINSTSQDKQVSVSVKCGVSYESDLEEVEKAAIEVGKHILKTVPGAVKDFTPVVRFNTFGESNVEFNVILRAQEFGKKFLLSHELIKALKVAFDKKGIEISYPVRKVQQMGHGGHRKHD